MTLVAAVRSAAVTLCAAALAAAGSAVGQPLTVRDAASAAIVMGGGLLWVRCAPGGASNSAAPDATEAVDSIAPRAALRPGALEAKAAADSTIKQSPEISESQNL